VVRSARTGTITLAAVSVAAGVTGCVTTQEKNGWRLLVNARTLASQKRVHVTRINTAVRVQRVALVHGGAGAAVVVRLRNLTRRPLTDLPISVGVRGPNRTTSYLNRKANIDYYNTHVPAIGADATTIWVLPVREAEAHRLRGRPFADVGFASTPPTTEATRLPQIDVREHGRSGEKRLRLLLANQSGLPQFGVQVYAVSAHKGRYVAAGRASIGDLGGGANATVGITLLGNPAHGSVQLSAPPTIFK
jgi:hypothetical protein